MSVLNFPFFPLISCRELLNVSRTNVPTSYTNVVHRPDSSGQECTIIYKFSSTPMPLDDLSLAMAESLFEATQLLAEVDGNEDAPVRTQAVTIKGHFYDFDVGSDLYAEEGSFKLWHLGLVVQDLISMWRRFNLRECTFAFRTEGAVLLQGHLKNGPEPSAPREIPPDPYIIDQFGGFTKYFSYSETISYEATVLAVLDILDLGWNLMVAKRRSDVNIRLEDNYYTHTKAGIRIDVQAAEAGKFLLEYLLQAADAIASFGRTFEMRALQFVLALDDKPTAAGFVVSSESAAIVSTNWTATE